MRKIKFSHKIDVDSGGAVSIDRLTPIHCEICILETITEHVSRCPTIPYDQLSAVSSMKATPDVLLFNVLSVGKMSIYVVFAIF
jgi:hypothetical protein